MERGLYTEDHEQYRAMVREFVAREVTPHLDEWDEQQSTGREVWLAAGKQGVIGLTTPEQYGGPGLDDWRYRNVVYEELFRAGAASLASSFSLQDDILIPYVTAMGDDEQKQRWLPGMASGETIMAVAMTEPGTGSDLKGVRTHAQKVPGGWRLNGAKTFISSGQQADLVCVVTRTDAAGGTDAFSLLVVEAGMSGFERGRNLKKVGLWAQDTSELSFTDVFVPDENLLGTEGGGFRHLMGHLPLERLSIAAGAVASTTAALDWTITYVKERHAFGQPLAGFQNTQFVLADMATELEAAESLLDRCILAYNSGSFTAVDAAKVKLFTTEVQARVVDKCVQLHGGYGYMIEYPIAKAYLDARVQRIYGGTNEIQRQIIGRALTGMR
ncbi:acyl-CoA dehydrogenase family protein [Nocardioides panzhihuensis]|uniref:Long-chain-acyl-CoA dehydrogenase n=1 Tax=Nocardioides panzhihuensis TaxID=860243 RepID=A0A7Z0DHR1_9ACTN|nr:acyl-CoA dehydrogenase family protein [Nocardioides panzhihuensis]NYI75511.1 long-chain-acyl-CoA dehydrogenase [Nocardioides panzhihuensis]